MQNSKKYNKNLITDTFIDVFNFAAWYFDPKNNCSFIKSCINGDAEEELFNYELGEIQAIFKYEELEAKLIQN